jgi:hypothetical protein
MRIDPVMLKINMEKNSDYSGLFPPITTRGLNPWVKFT